MEDLVEYMARALVEKPEAVRVKTRRSRGRLMFRLYVDSNDAGRVIGKGGRVANAMRSVLRVAATRQEVDVSLKIL